ncbi:target of EGR1 protein 1-like protein [Dinothrombium tinctorium]|uniref:Target of EGR1 protein 1-like protein n=1 Tax=Dinothrombium tinctorium TaxID=1965070 RepID=A0A443QDY1_9ACAR|nr:target of EGR1 protein 1-like protein [Dinothrombium tinctorium]
MRTSLQLISGIGDKNNFKISNIEDRYKALVEIAKSRAIVSVGLSFFRYNGKNANDGREMNYSVENYDILVFCVDEYVNEKEATEFLANHGFDFELQKSCGLPFYKGNDKKNDEFDSYSLRLLIIEMIQRKIPIVFHNGFADLIFLYQNFYCQLPNNLQTFLCDLKEMFSKGIYDTKYIAESEDRSIASFLEYTYYGRQLLNMERKFQDKWYVNIEFDTLDLNSPYSQIKDLSCVFLSKKPEGVKVCKNYSYHGWCVKGTSCPNSHNIHLILHEKIERKSKKAKQNINKVKKFYEDNKLCEENDEKNDEAKEKTFDPSANPMNVNSGIHSSGFDAFMTGYCFAVYIALYGGDKVDAKTKFTPTNIGLKRFHNSLYLTGKDIPLKVNASSYSRVSQNHKTKIEKIKKGDFINKQPNKNDNKAEDNV